MNTYRVTIYNEISQKKRRINVKASNIYYAIKNLSYSEVHYASESIIKVELWHDKK